MLVFESHADLQRHLDPLNGFYCENALTVNLGHTKAMISTAVTC